MMWSRPQRHDEHSSGEGEQSYLASAADLMIGLLFVFIIMVAFLALQKKAEQEAREGDRDPRGTVTLAIGNEIKNTLNTVKIDPASGVITLPEDLLFDSGSSILKDTAIQRLGETSIKLSDVLKCFVANQRGSANCKNNPFGHEIETIFIEGHTDSLPMNREGGNTKLSLDRAISVNNAMVQGTPLTSFKNHQGHPIFSYSAYAENRPLIKNDPTDGRNRRVDLRIVLTYRPAGGDTAIEGVSRFVVKP
jgi:flagellar motor protein MotB